MSVTGFTDSGGGFNADDDPTANLGNQPTYGGAQYTQDDQTRPEDDPTANLGGDDQSGYDPTANLADNPYGSDFQTPEQRRKTYDQSDPTASLGYPGDGGIGKPGPPPAYVNRAERNVPNTGTTPDESRQLSGPMTDIFRAGDQVKQEQQQESGSLQGEWRDIGQRIDDFNARAQIGNVTQDEADRLNAALADLQQRTQDFQNRDPTQFYADRFSGPEQAYQDALAGINRDRQTTAGLAFLGDLPGYQQAQADVYGAGGSAQNPNGAIVSDMGNMQQAQAAALAQFTTDPANMSPEQARLFRGVAEDQSMLGQVANRQTPWYEGTGGEVQGPPLPGDQSAILSAANDPNVRGFYRDSSDPNAPWQPFTVDQQDAIQQRANAGQISVAPKSAAESIAATAPRPGGTDPVSTGRILGVTALVAGAGLLGPAAADLMAMAAPAIATAAPTLGRVAQVAQTAYGGYEVAKGVKEAAQGEWGLAVPELLMGGFNILTAGITGKAVEGIASFGASRGIGVAEPELAAVPSAVRAAMNAPVVFQSAPNDLVQVSRGKLLAAVLLNGVPEAVPYVPDTLHHPAGLAIDMINRTVQGFADGSLPTKIADTLFHDPARIFNPGALKDAIGGLFSQDDVTYQRQQGLQDFIKQVDPALGYPNWRIQAAVSAASIVAMNLLHSGTYAQDGGILARVDPFLHYANAYDANVRAGMPPARAADAAYDSLSNGIAEWMWVVNPHNPAWSWLSFPKFSQAIDAAMARYATKELPTADLITGAQSLSDRYTGRFGGYDFRQLFTDLSKVNATRKLSGEVNLGLQAAIPAGAQAEGALAAFNRGARDFALARIASQDAVTATRLGDVKRAAALTTKAATLEASAQANIRGMLIASAIGTPLPAAPVKRTAIWEALARQTADAAIARQVDAKGEAKAPTVAKYFNDRVTLQAARFAGTADFGNRARDIAARVPGFSRDPAALARLAGIEDITSHVQDYFRTQVGMRTSWLNDEDASKILGLAQHTLGAIRTGLIAAVAPSLAGRKLPDELIRSTAASGKDALISPGDFATVQRAAGKLGRSTGALGTYANEVGVIPREILAPVFQPRGEGYTPTWFENVLQRWSDSLVGATTRHARSRLFGTAAEGFGGAVDQHFTQMTNDLRGLGFTDPQIAAMTNSLRFAPGPLTQADYIQAGRAVSAPNPTLTRQVRQLFADYGAQRAQLALNTVQAGYNLNARAIGNFGEASPVAQAANWLYPFAEFHINATRVGLANMAKNPLYAYAMAKYLADNQDEFGRLPVAGGYVGDLTRLYTGMHTLDFFRRWGEYAQQAINDPSGNNTALQTAGRIAAHGIVGPGALVRAFPYADLPGMAAENALTSPVRDAKGKVVYDDQLRAYSTANGPTGVIRYLGDRLAPNETVRQAIRTAAPYIGNPAGVALSKTGEGIANLLGMEMQPPSDIYRQLPYDAPRLGQQLGWSRERTQAAMNNPQTPDGQALKRAFETQYDKDTMAKLSPVQLTRMGQPQEKPIFAAGSAESQYGGAGRNDSSIPPGQLIAQPGDFAYQDITTGNYSYRDPQTGEWKQGYNPELAAKKRANAPARTDASTLSQQLRTLESAWGKYAPQTIEAARALYNAPPNTATARGLVPESQARALGDQRRLDALQGFLNRTYAFNRPADEQALLQREIAPGFSLNDYLHQPGNLIDVLGQYARAKEAGASKDELRVLGNRTDDVKGRIAAEQPLAAAYLTLTDKGSVSAPPTPGQPAASPPMSSRTPTVTAPGTSPRTNPQATSGYSGSAPSTGRTPSGTSTGGPTARGSNPGSNFFDFWRGITDQGEKNAVYDAFAREGIKIFGERSVSAETFAKALETAKRAVVEYQLFGPDTRQQSRNTLPGGSAGGMTRAQAEAAIDAIAAASGLPGGGGSARTTQPSTSTIPGGLSGGGGSTKRPRYGRAA